MPRAVLFFDGLCGLCNGFVDFVLARDRRARLSVAALQGETALALVPEDAPVVGGEDPRSLVLWEDGKVLRKSDAALRALELLGGPWRLARAFRVVPRFARDAVYDLVARNRHRWFGRRTTCRAPTAAERARFLP